MWSGTGSQGYGGQGHEAPSEAEEIEEVEVGGDVEHGAGPSPAAPQGPAL